MSQRNHPAFYSLILIIAFSHGALAQAPPAATEKTNAGPLVIRPLTHASLLFEFRGKNYYVDPAGNFAWGSLPKADVILITHEHGDHCSPETVAQIRKPETIIAANAASAAKFPGALTLKNGDRKRLLDVTVQAVPAYNMVRTQPNGQFYHPKGRDNGYVLRFGDRRVYVAGDTEAIPEMKALRRIDIAFLPINLPYTMPPSEAAAAARAFKPRILYPYHQGKSDPAELKHLLAGEKGIEVRVLKLP
jgi:L-ascorbate metabolism protein UlaG (beta-lactamase superfamily)